MKKKQTNDSIEIEEIIICLLPHLLPLPPSKQKNRIFISYIFISVSGSFLGDHTFFVVGS